jgi:hypothetical protein
VKFGKRKKERKKEKVRVMGAVQQRNYENSIMYFTMQKYNLHQKIK